MEDVIAEITENLRSTIRRRPESESEVQDALENLFTIKGYDFEREKVSISYSTKAYMPDFTSDSLNVTVDVKLCKSPQDERKIIDELNADIPAYQSKYKKVLFIVYDLGCIRKTQVFIKGIEEHHQDVSTKVIKH